MQINKEQTNGHQLLIYNPQKDELKKSYMKKGLKGLIFCKYILDE